MSRLDYGMRVLTLLTLKVFASAAHERSAALITSEVSASKLAEYGGADSDDTVVLVQMSQVVVLRQTAAGKQSPTVIHRRIGTVEALHHWLESRHLDSASLAGVIIAFVAIAFAICLYGAFLVWRDRRWPHGTTSETDLKHVQYAFFLIGSGLELPYLALITAVDFFEDTYSGNIVYLISFLFDPPAFLATLVLVVGWCKWMGHAHFRVLVLYIVEAILLIFVCFVPSLFGVGNQLLKTIMTLSAVAIIGLCCGTLHFACFGNAAQLDSSCIQSLESGICLGGFLVSFFKLLTKGIPMTDDVRSLLYFGLGAFWCIACCTAQSFVVGSPLRARMRKVIDVPPPDERKGLPEGGVVSRSPSSSSLDSWEGKFNLFWNIRWHFALTLVSLATTFLGVPGLASSVQSKYQGFNNANWFSVSLMVEFHLCNLLGSLCPLPGRGELGFSQYQAQMLTWFVGPAKLLLVVFLAMYSNAESHMTLDLFPHFFVVVQGLSNGFLIAHAGAGAVEGLHDDEEAATGEYIAAAFNLGIVCGTAASFTLEQCAVFPI